MREILFRGKPTKRFGTDDKFIYGSLVVSEGRCFIVTWLQASYNLSKVNCNATGVEVIAESVGQFTGLADKNGNEIFEGDIVKIADHPFGYDGLYAVRYNEHMELCCGDLLLFRVIHWCEVIGNIHDNLELLESEG